MVNRSSTFSLNTARHDAEPISSLRSMLYLTVLLLIYTIKRAKRYVGRTYHLYELVSINIIASNCYVYFIGWAHVMMKNKP